MNERLARRSSLFLLELMISILLFSIASAWCIRLFVTARDITSTNEELSRARNLAAGYAEIFLVSGDFEAFLREEGGVEKEADGTLYQFWYDKDWNVCAEEDAAFCFETVIIGEGDFEKCAFRFSRAESEEINYLLDVEKYTGGEVSS